jgi:hypothetical protein
MYFLQWVRDREIRATSFTFSGSKFPSKAAYFEEKIHRKVEEGRKGETTGLHEQTEGLRTRSLL